MAKFKLNYHGLNCDSDVEYLEFKNTKERYFFLQEKIIGAMPKRVFILIIHHTSSPTPTNKELSESENNSVYIFDWWDTIEKYTKEKWDTFSLFEFESYECAYKTALDLQETNPLCYS